MSEALEAFRDILGILCAVSGCEVDIDSQRVKTVKHALLKLEAIKNKLDRWIELLQIDGRNTKHQVLMEMKELSEMYEV